jgi:hypothetical protein
MACCAALDGTAGALSGRGGGYRSENHHRQAGVEARLRELDELLALSAAQKVQVKGTLQRLTDKDAAPQIRALLTDRQRSIYDHAHKPAQE